jgi:hypothetical protein
MAPQPKSEEPLHRYPRRMPSGAASKTNSGEANMSGGSSRVTRWLGAAAAMAVLLSGSQSLFAETASAKDTDTRKVKLDPRPKGERKHVSNTRGMAFGGAAVFVGTGRNERAHVYTATSCGNLVPGSIEKIDAKKEAAALGTGVTGFMGNVGRNWTMDEIDMHVGEIVDFQGVKMCWAGDMTGEEIRSQFSGAYGPAKIIRDTDWIYKAGKPIYVLREPGGIVWVMQEYTKAVDPSLTIDNLSSVGSKLKKLPEGWVFETVILRKDLSLDTRRSGLWASILRDELGNTYEATGFDDIANYVP